MGKKRKGLYIQLYHIHGLFRGSNLELGRDADTGGQTKYVLDLANALSKHPKVEKIEVITRLIRDKEVSKDYSKKIEKVNDKFSIVRIYCGGGKYIRKELLWPHLEEFVDNSIKYINSQGKLPDVVHSHYADAGYVCTELTKFFGIPFIHTGHSLGKVKKQSLLDQGWDEDDINKKYKIDERIKAEEDIIFYSDRIITSTNQEINVQYGNYDNFEKGKFIAIPPGVDLNKFRPFSDKREWKDKQRELRQKIREELWKFFTNMYKPIIFTLCRPEKRKNITGLIEAYGEDKELQELANLAIFAGIRKDIKAMPEIEREVLTEILLLLDKYNLYGKMAIPKRHDIEYEVPELYRIAAESRGVFVNSAYSETFGLTLIESAASGLPVVATNAGGPSDIVKNLENGLLVDVNNSQNISVSIKEVLKGNNNWNKFSVNGIERVHSFYSWKAHTDTYLNMIAEEMNRIKEAPKLFIDSGKRLFNYEKLMFFDIDDTLLGDENALEELRKIISNKPNKVGIGVATGRTIESARKVLCENNVDFIDMIISTVGTEIYYKQKNDFVYSKGWEKHISQKWQREKIVELLSEFDFLEYQEETNQRKFRVCYYLKENQTDKIELAKQKLIKNKINCNFVFSHDLYIDILPYRASKGRAIRYLSYRWNIPHNSILVAGDSGNDFDMLRGELLGIVVGNYSEELEELKGRRRIYFAKGNYAWGIIEGIKKYKFLTK